MPEDAERTKPNPAPRRRRAAAWAVAVALTGVLAGLCVSGWSRPLMAKVFGGRTVEQRLAELAGARQRLAERFATAGLAYPPGRVVLVGCKRERRLDVYAARTDGADLLHVHAYPILAASGRDGPKLREGDRQVPEGVYGIESLNPNSRFHVALRVNYPNGFDRSMARRDERKRLGGDIMIHGGSASVGCLAMGDPAAEELFVLAADVRLPNVQLVLAPYDLRGAPQPSSAEGPRWLPELYDQIAAAMRDLPRH